MTRFFMLIKEDHWRRKNKLDVQWKAYCQTLDRVIIEGRNERQQVLIKALKKMEELNAAHPNCTPLQWHTWNGREHEEATFLGVPNVATLAIYQERKEATHG
jgi:hypothetical protein